MPLSPGDKLGAYEILSKLGEGGMGEVYRAHDPRLERDVAAKVLLPEFGNAPRFEQEAKALASLNHPNILAVYEFGEHEGAAFLISELVQGETLRSAMGRGLSLKQTLDIAAQICDGLGAAHAIGIAHRDLKPENVMVTREGVVKILDFGLARRKRSPKADEATLTVGGMVMGTIGYMSPEQAAGQEAGPLSDIFSMGVVLFEMLAGKQPFQRQTMAESMTATIREDPAPLPDSVPPGLRQMVTRCLEKIPAKRFQSATDLAFTLRSVTTTTSVPVAAPTAAAARKMPLALLAVVALLAAAGGFLLRHVLSGPERFPASAVRMQVLAAAPESELNPEFSPDGKFLAYWRNRLEGRLDLLVRPIHGSPSEPLVRNIRQIPSLLSAWAPDGNRLFYTDDNSIYSVTPSGGEPQLVIKDYRSFTLSPDGKHLLVVKQDESKRWSVFDSSPPGAALKPLIEFPRQGDLQMRLGRFSPDGKQYLAMTSALSTNFHPTVWAMPFPQGKPRLLLEEPHSVSPNAAAWYPDSRHIVYSVTAQGGSDHVLKVVDTANGALRDVVLRSPDPIISLALSPDGTNLVFSLGPVNWSAVEYDLDSRQTTRIEESRIWQFHGNYTADGTQFLWTRRIGNTTTFQVRSPEGKRVFLEVPATGSASGRLAPDGRRVAYGGTGKLWVAAAGGKPVALAEGAMTFRETPCWSADGRFLAYFKQDGPKQFLEVVDSGGGAVRRLAPGGGTSCAWSADGKWIAHLGGNTVLRVTDTANGETRGFEEFRTAGGSFGDQGRLYVTRMDQGKWLLSTIEVPSGKELRAEPVPIEPSIATSIVIHPSGRRLAYSVGVRAYDLWTMDMPQPATGIARLWRKWTLRPEAAKAPVE